MKNILVFAGTTEGRQLVEILNKSRIKCHVCVATEYGSQLIKESDYITVHEGRLDMDGMKALYESISCDVVVDATHPYATLVTKTIKESLKGSSISYLRLLRENDVLISDSGSSRSFYEDTDECISALLETEGNILLTTGSKELGKYCKRTELKERIYARVIPGLESLKLCYDAGLEGKQIIAMQGPFSQKMNEATIEEYDIKHMVTKESGSIGGLEGKLAAAASKGINVHIIKRPGENQDTINGDLGLSFAKTVKALERIIGYSLKRGDMNIVLAGIGPGNYRAQTIEVKDAIYKADYIFGAARMLEGLKSDAVKYPYYLKKDIIPKLEEIYEDNYIDKNVVILFSGDSGFYSGARKMYDALNQNSSWNVKIMPGISSVSALSAAAGIDWQDSNILSLHGVDKAEWLPALIDSVSHSEKTFFITSGVADVNEVGKLLQTMGGDYILHLGYNLSYPDEKVLVLNPDECVALTREGLYCGLVLNKKAARRYLVPTLGDDDFVRDKVPMTKEAVRKLSICQMKVKEGDIVYDIGSGTGSIAVQTAMLSSKVKVYAIECNEEAVELINKNVSIKGLHNVTVINDMAPKGLSDLPKADIAFIGGSKGNLKEILDKLYQINKSMRVVMNAVSMESICQMNELIKEYSITDLSVEQISVSQARKVGNYNMLSANNPVFIYSFQFV